MKTYAVYRTDFFNHTKVPIGTVIERREKERNKNAADMLRYAQMVFGESSIDKLHITVSPE